MRDISKQHEMEALPPLSGLSSDDGRGIFCYDGLIDLGAFELLLGGVSHITHKALVLIAALYAGLNASHW